MPWAGSLMAFQAVIIYLPKLMSGEIAVEGRRPERPLSCQPNGNALGMETETNNRPVGAKD